MIRLAGPLLADAPALLNAHANRLDAVIAGGDHYDLLQGRYSNAKMRFQSFFMLITDQPFFFASS